MRRKLSPLREANALELKQDVIKGTQLNIVVECSEHVVNNRNCAFLKAGDKLLTATASP